MADMQAISLPVVTADDAARLVRALGKHRYVAGRALWVHALAADLDDGSELSAWAKKVLADESIDPASRDERLSTKASEDDVARLLLAYWGEDPAARERLAARLDELGIEPPTHEPFDESAEDEVFPLLIDAGWELLPLASLDAERHKGAIAAFGDPLWFESARFEEENAMPKPVYLQELPAFGPNELLLASERGELRHELVLWVGGDETYQDYVVRGAMKVAKLG